VKVRVKVCGLTDEAALEAACEAGADAVGLVLAPSPRRVTLARARELLRRVPAGIERVLVFALARRDELSRALDLGPDALQAELGSEWPELSRGTYALPVLRDGPHVEAHAAELSRPRSTAASSLHGALMLDGPRGGGRGLPVDLERAARLASRHPIVLAGGLTPDNVAARTCAIRPFAVDASSGLERTPGVKDPERIRAFVRAVRRLERESLEVST